MVKFGFILVKMWIGLPTSGEVDGQLSRNYFLLGILRSTSMAVGKLIRCHCLRGLEKSLQGFIFKETRPPLTKEKELTPGMLLLSGSI